MRLLYITTVGLILSNVLTLVLAYAMVTSVKDSIYQSGTLTQPLRTEARTPLQYDEGGGTVGGGTSSGGTKFCTLCDDAWEECQAGCLKYPTGSSAAIGCLSECQQKYAQCRSVLCN